MRYFPAILLFIASPSLAAEVQPLALLADAEQSYYTQIFDYTMDNIKPDGHFDWASYSGKGSIAPDKSFVSKSGAVCRNFTETYNVQGHAGGDKGIGCKRVGKDGWCKLKEGNALTCALEHPSYLSGLGGTGGVNGGVNTDININVNSGGSGDDSGSGGPAFPDPISTPL